MTVQHPAAEVYDFKRPTTLARQQTRALEQAFETFSRQWGTQLTASLRVMSQVAFDQVVVESYADYAASLPARTTMVLCAMGEHPARAVIQFPPDAAFSWIATMLGATSPIVAPDRRYTPIELAIVRRLAAGVLEDLAYSFGGILIDDLVVESVHENSMVAQATAPSDLMVVGAFLVRAGGGSAAEASIAIPLAQLLPRLGADVLDAVAGHAPDRLLEHVISAPVDVALRLREVPVSPRQVLDLAVGDLIPLPHAHTRPFDLAVDGRTIARAAAGAVGARLAGVVIDLEESA